jgi:hypothetical protein
VVDQEDKKLDPLDIPTTQLILRVNLVVQVVVVLVIKTLDLTHQDLQPNQDNLKDQMAQTMDLLVEVLLPLAQITQVVVVVASVVLALIHLQVLVV